MINRRTADTINRIGKLLMDNNNEGMSRAAIARECNTQRSHISRLLIPFTGDTKCFKVNTYGEVIVNISNWNKDENKFKDRAIKAGVAARATSKVSAENTITVDPRFKYVLTLINAALSSINSGEAAQQLVSKLGRLTEPTKEYRAIKAILVAADSIGNLPVDTKGDDLMLKVMKELGIIGNAKDNDSVTI